MRKVAGAMASVAIVLAGMSMVGVTTALAGGGVVSFSYSDGSFKNVGCGVGDVGSTAHNGLWPTRADNGCATRVRLFADANEKGATLCLNAVTNTGTLKNTWESYRVESPKTC